MPHIVIISSSVRTGRNSHRVSLFFRQFIVSRGLATAEILDLYQYQFPIFEERLRMMDDPSPDVMEFAGKVNHADGIIIVTPEYNGGYPASLKNVIDLMYAEWKRKPVALATVSNGPFGGSQVMASLLLTLWKIGCNVVPAMYRVANVTDNYDQQGNPLNDNIPRFAKAFVDELAWYMAARKKMEEEDYAARE